MMIKSSITLFLFLFTLVGNTQVVGYDVFGVQTNPRENLYPLVTLDTLQSAQTLDDLIPLYRPSWVAEYLSVKVSSICQIEERTAFGKNDSLTSVQLNILRAVGKGCTANVLVKYIPANNLTYNPPREMAFTLRMKPLYEAKYPNGYQALKLYLKETIIDQLPPAVTETIALTRVRFTIDEAGEVVDIQTCTSSTFDDVDQLIINALAAMPKWAAATNLQGTKMKQVFEFTLGTDLLRCDYQYRVF